MKNAAVERPISPDVNQISKLELTILEYICSQKHPPTHKEMAEHFELAVSKVQRVAVKLRKHGHLETIPSSGESRRRKFLVPVENDVTIPLIIDALTMRLDNLLSTVPHNTQLNTKES